MPDPILKKHATTAIILHNGKFLIGKRQRDDLWELPGGKIDPGETPAECIIRELKEELNIDIRILKELNIISGTYRNIPMDVHVFLTEWAGGSLEKNVHKELRWIKREEIPTYKLVDEDLIAFKQL